MKNCEHNYPGLVTYESGGPKHTCECGQSEFSFFKIRPFYARNPRGEVKNLVPGKRYRLSFEGTYDGVFIVDETGTGFGSKESPMFLTIADIDSAHDVEEL